MSDQYVMVSAEEEITARLLVRLRGDADPTDRDVIQDALQEGAFWSIDRDVRERHIVGSPEPVTESEADRLIHPTPVVPADLAAKVRDALCGDSNDAEHDALYEVASWLGLDVCVDCADTGYLIDQTYDTTDPPDGGHFVQRCDQCDNHVEGDRDAAKKAAAARGWRFGYDHRPGDPPDWSDPASTLGSTRRSPGRGNCLTSPTTCNPTPSTEGAAPRMATTITPEQTIVVNSRRAALGRKSLAARGTPILGLERDQVIDAITDILHAAHYAGLNTVGLIDVAGENFDVEIAAAQLEALGGA